MPAVKRKPLYLWDFVDPKRLKEKKIEAMTVSLYKQFDVWVIKTSQPQKPRGMTVGIPDLRCYYRYPETGATISWWHEVKRWNEKPTDGQREFHALARSYDEEVIVGGVNTAIEWLAVHKIVELAPLAGHW